MHGLPLLFDKFKRQNAQKTKTYFYISELWLSVAPRKVLKMEGMKKANSFKPNFVINLEGESSNTLNLRGSS